MKKRKKAPPSQLGEIYPLLIKQWRRLLCINDKTPVDRLQTREFRRATKALKILHEGLDIGNNLRGFDYFSKPDLLATYLLYHWVFHYQEGLSLINELPTPPSTVLDIAGGSGPYALAALQHGAQEVIIADQNQAALDLGSEIAGRCGFPINVQQWDIHTGKRDPFKKKFDLITLTHSLEELFPTKEKGWATAQSEFIERLLGMLTPTGHLLIVENSWDKGNQRILALRDRMVADNVPVQAPCLWKEACPALRDKAPCYAQREMERPYTLAQLQRAARIKMSSLKMSYVIFCHPSARWPQLDNEGKDLYRVISPKITTHQGQRYYVCGSEGKKAVDARFKPTSNTLKAFDFMQRGDVINIKDAVPTGNNLLLSEHSSLTIHTPKGKPLKTALVPTNGVVA